MNKSGKINNIATADSLFEKRFKEPRDKLRHVNQLPVMFIVGKWLVYINLNSVNIVHEKKTRWFCQKVSNYVLPQETDI